MSVTGIGNVWPVNMASVSPHAIPVSLSLKKFKLMKVMMRVFNKLLYKKIDFNK